MVFAILFDKDFIVTSLDDSHEDKPRSLHNAGLAFDCRIHHLSPEQAQRITEILRLNLDPLGFDTVLEGDHIHCEYDPKPGERLWTMLPKPQEPTTHITDDLLGQS